MSRVQITCIDSCRQDGWRPTSSSYLLPGRETYSAAMARDELVLDMRAFRSTGKHLEVMIPGRSWKWEGILYRLQEAE